MSERSKRWFAAAMVAFAGGIGASAYGLPWDIDMADSPGVKAYESAMPALQDGVIAQPSITSPKDYALNYVRGSAEGMALTNPHGEDLVLGKKMYETYCTPCHGNDGINLGAVAQPGRLPGVVPLAGPAGVAKSRVDGWIYLTIRNGGAIMPPYGHAMSDREMWSVVSYVRTLDNSKYIPPEAP